jgi:hypothetical protein
MQYGGMLQYSTRYITTSCSRVVQVAVVLLVQLL